MGKIEVGGMLEGAGQGKGNEGIVKGEDSSREEGTAFSGLQVALPECFQCEEQGWGPLVLYLNEGRSR